MRIAEILFYDTNKAKLVVELTEPRTYSTATLPRVPRALFELLPNLAKHTCYNDDCVSFEEECRATEIPHLLEHLIIELQAAASGPVALSGETQWNWRVDPRGLFHVHVEYENEQLALAAIRLAERLLSAAMFDRLDELDLARELERLRSIASLSAPLRPETDTRYPPRLLTLAAGSR